LVKKLKAYKLEDKYGYKRKENNIIIKQKEIKKK